MFSGFTKGTGKRWLRRFWKEVECPVVRRHVKTWLKLDLPTADAFLYTPKSDGGLGITCLTRAIGLVISLLSLSSSNDETVRISAEQWNAQEEVHKRCQSLNIEVLESSKKVPKWSFRMKTEWAQLPRQGSGVLAFANRKAKQWIGRSGKEKEYEWIKK